MQTRAEEETEMRIADAFLNPFWGRFSPAHPLVILSAVRHLGVIVDFQVEELNDAAEHLTGTSNLEYRGRKLVGDHDSPSAFELFDALKCIFDGKDRSMRVRLPSIIHPDRWIDVHGVQIDDERIALAIRDVTDLVAQSQALEEALSEARRQQARYRALTELIPQLVWVTNPDMRLIDWNKAFVEYGGLLVDEVRERGWDALVYPGDYVETMDAWAQAREVTFEFQCVHRLLRQDDQTFRWHLSRATPQYNDLGKVEAWFGTSTDIHESRLISNRQRSIMESLRDGLIVVDPAGIIVSANPQAERILGLSPGELVKRRAMDWSWRPVNRDLTPFPLENFPAARILSGETSVIDEFIGIHRPNSELRWLRVNAVPLNDPVYGYSAVVSFSDVTDLIYQQNLIERQKEELERHNARLAALATMDGLTGLLNHRAIHERLVEAFQLAARHSRPLSVVMFDVDHFKLLNDAFGHLEGDRTLATLAQLIRDAARAGDIIGRYGGEEFIIVMPETEMTEAAAAAERLRLMIEDFKWSAKSITASFGVSTRDHSTTQARTLIEKADFAMYEAKRNGRNKVRLAP